MRRKRQVSAKKLLERLENKVSGAYLTKIELWDHVPSADLIADLCDKLKIDVAAAIDAAKKDAKIASDKRLERVYRMYDDIKERF